jgi:cyclopropane-fatty-acyl-phospholipid synthase
MGLLATTAVRDPKVELSLRFLNDLLADYPGRDYQVRLWEGTTWGDNQPRFTLVLKHPGSLRAMFLNPSDLTLGESYIHDDFDIEGDIEAAMELGSYLVAQERSFPNRLHLAARLRQLPVSTHPRSNRWEGRLQGRIHSRDRDRQAVCSHYDLPTEFYASFLDRRMVYSCAYFAKPEEDLDLAQERKLDYLCRKLRLRRGERLLDIGCGWGALIMHAVAHYGVEAVGITLSARQAEVTRQRIHEASLEERCHVDVSDYRDIGKAQQYDKIVSVGMFEHVGEALLPEYFRLAWDQLRPGGVFVNHGIACCATFHRRGPSFSDRYVFPDSELVPISTTLRAAELTGFEVRDVESLREHYAMTLHHWVRRLEAHSAEARRITDETTYRIWRLYMAGAAHRMRIGRLNIYQALLAKPLNGRGGLPLTREDWYRV